MTLQRLQNAAYARFADQGYEAATLSQIAGDVGIKKPSVYAHFKSKEDLFLSLIEPAIEGEYDYFRSLLTSSDDALSILYKGLTSIGERFETIPYSRFWMRTTYLPPMVMYDKVIEHVHNFMCHIEDLFLGLIETIPNLLLPAQTLAAAYVGIISGLQAELLYGGEERYKSRLEAMWAVFLKSLKG